MGVERQEEIFTTYRPKVTAYVKSRIPHTQDAEDTVSAVFLKICDALEQFDESRASFSTWVYTITRNTVTDYFRIQGKQGILEDIEEVTLLGPMEDMPEEVLLQEENLDLLADALMQLSQRERDLIVLRYYHDKSLKDAAQLLQISYGNAKFIHHGAIKKLRGFFMKGADIPVALRQ